MKQIANLIAAALAEADKLERMANADASNAGRESTMKDALRWRDLAAAADAELGMSDAEKNRWMAPA